MLQRRGIALDPEDLGVPVGFSAMSSIGTGVSSLSLGVIVYIRKGTRTDREGCAGPGCAGTSWRQVGRFQLRGGPGVFPTLIARPASAVTVA